MTKPVKYTLLAALVVLASGVAFWLSGPRKPSGPASSEPAAITASLRREPTIYNRYLEPTAAADLVSRLTDGRLIRVDLATDAVEPALAERWTQSEDGLTYTFSLRRDVHFSDGQPFTSADVMFSARVLYDPDLGSGLSASTLIDGKPLVFAAPDPFTVTVTLPAPFTPGLRLLENLPILPRHKLEAALNEKRLDKTWTVGTPLTEVTGLGPFVLKEHVTGQRMEFVRNPHYWRKDSEGIQLPYLDRITALIIPDQNTEVLRMGAGEIDLMVNGEIRPEDYGTFKRAADQRRVVLHDAGVGTDPNLLWFNLTDASRARLPWFHDTRVRQAISYAVNRQAIVDTVYLGAAVPIYGPVSPANRAWYSASAPQYPHDPRRAAELLKAAGLTDQNGDGMVEDGTGRPFRFSILTNKTTLRERTASLIQAHLKEVGVTVDVITLELGAIQDKQKSGDYDTVYYGFQASALDPALNLEFWTSNGDFHFWNPRQPTAATPWEGEVDALMARQAAVPTLSERQQIFAEVQRILGEQVPAIYFVAPRVTIAVNPRVRNVVPTAQSPHVLWNADMLAVDRR